MRVFHDHEFYEDGQRINLLASGLVNEAGETCYVINGEADYQAAAEGNPWLVANVFPHLPVAEIHGRWHVDLLDERVMPRDEMRHNIEQFLQYCSRLHDRKAGRPETLDRDNLELWAWYGAYDHVALCQLWGRMIDLPPFVPMYTNDLRQSLRQLGYTDGGRPTRAALLSDPEFLGGLWPEDEHNALADARYDLALHGWLADRAVELQDGRNRMVGL